MAHTSDIGPLDGFANVSVGEPLQPGTKPSLTHNGRLHVRVWTGAKSSDLSDPDNWRDTASSPAGAADQPAKEHPMIGKLRRDGMLAE